MSKESVKPEDTSADLDDERKKIVIFFRTVLDILPEEFWVIPFLAAELPDLGVPGILEKLATTADLSPIILSLSEEEREKLYRHVPIFFAQPDHGFLVARKLFRFLLKIGVNPDASSEYLENCLAYFSFGSAAFEDVQLLQEKGFDFEKYKEDWLYHISQGMKERIIEEDLEVWKEKTRWVLEFFQIPEEKIIEYLNGPLEG